MCAKWKTEKGSVMMEAVIVMPLLLISVMAAGQFAHILLARQFASIAAYNGCRAAIRATGNMTTAAETAVKETISPQEATSLMSYQNAQVTKADSANGYCTVSIKLNFPLVCPVVNYAVAGILGCNDTGFYADESKKHSGITMSGTDAFPCITLTETAVLPMPYKVEGGTK